MTKKIRTTVGLFDVHLDDKGYNKVYGLVKRFIRDFKPDEVVIGGDFMDVDSLSHWNESKRMVMEGKRYIKEVKVANNELDYLQKYAGKITYILGNHEDWVQQYIEKHPEMDGIINIPLVLKLKDRDIQWVASDSLYKTGHLYWTHGESTGIHHAKKHATDFGCCLVYGHTHNPQVYSHVMKMQDPYSAWGVGCLCDHAPAYMKRKHANWRDQFVVVYHNKDGSFNIYPVDIVNNKFVFNGKEYS